MKKWSVLLFIILFPICVQAQDGTIKWTFEGVSGHPALGTDGTIYVPGEEELFAINPDGTEKWKFELGDLVGGFPSVATDGTVYILGKKEYDPSIGEKTCALYAINPDGTLKWAFTPEPGVTSGGGQTIAADGTIYVYFGDLFAINPDGTEKWRFSCKGVYPVIAADGTVYAGGYATLYAISPLGVEKWSFRIATEDGLSLAYISSNLSLGSDGTLYFGKDNYLYALNPDGTVKWKYKAYGDVDYAPSIGPDGTAYLMSGALCALDSEGVPQEDFFSGITSSSLSAYDTVPTISEDGTIYAIGINTFAINPDGTVKWALEEGREGSRASCPAIGTDGTLYACFNSGFPSYNGYLCAINTTSGGLADSSWPTFQHDMQRTGRLPYTGPGNDGNDNSTCSITYLLQDDNSQLDTFRQFRDEVLIKSKIGTLLTKKYYMFGKRIIPFLKEKPLIKSFSKKILKLLLPVVGLTLVK